MNLGKINDIINERGLRKGVFAQKVGMTRQNLDALIKNNTTKHATIVKIAKELDVPVSFFYEEMGDDVEQDPFPCKNKEEYENEIKFLMQQLHEKSDYIDMLKREIEGLNTELRK